MEHQRFEGERPLMRIHIGESDRWEHKPLHEAIVELFRREGFTGVTVLRGVAGYGSTSRLHTEKILRPSSKRLNTAREAKRFCHDSTRWSVGASSPWRKSASSFTVRARNNHLFLATNTRSPGSFEP